MCPILDYKVTIIDILFVGFGIFSGPCKEIGQHTLKKSKQIHTLLEKHNFKCHDIFLDMSMSRKKICFSTIPHMHRSQYAQNGLIYLTLSSQNTQTKPTHKFSYIAIFKSQVCYCKLIVSTAVLGTSSPTRCMEKPKHGF